MTKTNRLDTRQILFIFGAPLLILLSIFFFSKLPIADSPNLAFAISLDLILTVPIIYFLLIRKTKIPITTVVLFIIVGIFIGKKILPAEHHNVLDFARYIGIPLIEFSIIGYVIFRMRKIFMEFRKAKNETPDFVTTLRNAVQEVLPKKIGEIFVLEISMIYYCFFAWKKPTIPENGFTYHRKNSLHLIFGVFIGLVMVETFVFHILIERWSVTVAWIGTGISIYSIVQIIGILKSATRRPILFQKEKLMLRYGLMQEAEIRFDEIEKVELSRKSISNNPLVQKLGTELTGHNVIIYLKNKPDGTARENTLLGLFGIKKKFNILTLHVDEHQIFKNRIDEIILCDS